MNLITNCSSEEIKNLSSKNWHTIKTVTVVVNNYECEKLPRPMKFSLLTTLAQVIVKALS